MTPTVFTYISASIFSVSQVSKVAFEEVQREYQIMNIHFYQMYDFLCEVWKICYY